MSNFLPFIESMKRIAAGVFESLKPSDGEFGIVTKENPLEITIEKMAKILTMDNLVLCRNVTEFTNEMTVDHQTVEVPDHTHTATTTATSGLAGPAEVTVQGANKHLHDYKGRKEWLVHHNLLEGEKVYMQRMQGGQTYIVIDRVAG